jgi:hypothetical protein
VRSSADQSSWKRESSDVLKRNVMAILSMELVMKRDVWPRQALFMANLMHCRYSTPKSATAAARMQPETSELPEHATHVCAVFACVCEHAPHSAPAAGGTHVVRTVKLPARVGAGVWQTPEPRQRTTVVPRPSCTARSRDPTTKKSS